jgi:hypothetical protein
LESLFKRNEVNDHGEVSSDLLDIVILAENRRSLSLLLSGSRIKEVLKITGII